MQRFAIIAAVLATTTTAWPQSDAGSPQVGAAAHTPTSADQQALLQDDEIASQGEATVRKLAATFYKFDPKAGVETFDRIVADDAKFYDLLSPIMDRPLTKAQVRTNLFGQRPKSLATMRSNFRILSVRLFNGGPIIVVGKAWNSPRIGINRYWSTYDTFDLRNEKWQMVRSYQAEQLER